MERRYSRETPTPGDIRPISVLKKAFDYVVAKSKNKKEFEVEREGKEYLAHQLKGMRQDIKVQGLTDPFAVGVYEYNIRLVIEIGDNNEVLQGHPAVKQLHEAGHLSQDGAAAVAEFTSYRLLSYACSNEPSYFVDEVGQLGLASHLLSMSGGMGMPKPHQQKKRGKAKGRVESPQPQPEDIAPCYGWSFHQDPAAKTVSSVLSGEEGDTSTSSLGGPATYEAMAATMMEYAEFRNTVNLCHAISNADSVETTRILLEAKLFPCTVAYIRNIHLQRLRCNWACTVLQGFKQNIPLRFLLVALGFAPSESGSAKGQWLDGSLKAADEALFQFFQLLKLTFPPKFDLASEFKVQGHARKGYVPTTIDSETVRKAVFEYITELNTRKDARHAMEAARNA